MIALDGQRLFDEQQVEIEVGSIERGCVEKQVAGLDGVLSVDLGLRGRKIKQTGSFCAKGHQQMNERIGAISAYMDGKAHTLTTADTRQFENMRMDIFMVGRLRPSGVGVVTEYEIIYTQLAV